VTAIDTRTRYGTRGIITRDVVVRPLPDAQQIAAQWPGCYEVVVSVDGGKTWQVVMS